MPKIIYRDSSGVEHTQELGDEVVLIGRAPECRIQSQDGLVSRRHARIGVEGGIYYIEDMGSSNGVYVNAARVQRSPIRPGDEIVCGSLSMRFQADVAAAIRRTQGMAAVPDADALPSARTPHIPRANVTSLVDPPAAPPPAAPPPPAVPPPPAAAAPPAVAPSTAATAELSALRAELESERRRLTDMEFELSGLQRKNAQLESEVARLRGRAGGGGGGGGEVAALRAAESERDRLRTRVEELERQLAASAAASAPAAPTATSLGDAERDGLQRKIQQLQSELARVRGRGGAALAPVAAGGEGARIGELEEEVRRLRSEKDEALRKAQLLVRPSDGSSSIQSAARFSQELLEAQAQISRLEAALRQLRDAEKERDALRAQIAGGNVTRSVPTSSARVADILATITDELKTVRGTVRALGDEGAVEQLEGVLGQITELNKLLSAP
jgi:predicted component of type VI protein secretion system